MRVLHSICYGELPINQPRVYFPFHFSRQGTRVRAVDFMYLINGRVSNAVGIRSGRQSKNNLREEEEEEEEK